MEGLDCLLPDGTQHIKEEESMVLNDCGAGWSFRMNRKYSYSIADDKYVSGHIRSITNMYSSEIKAI